MSAPPPVMYKGLAGARAAHAGKRIDCPNQPHHGDNPRVLREVRSFAKQFGFCRLVT